MKKTGMFRKFAALMVIGALMASLGVPALAEEDVSSEPVAAPQVEAPAAKEAAAEKPAPAQEAETEKTEAEPAAEEAADAPAEEDPAEEASEEETPAEEIPAEEEENTEQETETVPKETPVRIPIEVTITSNLDGVSSVCPGTLMELTVHVKDPANRTYAVSWEVSEDGGSSWEAIPGANENTYSVVLDLDNAACIWRASVITLE